jgi:hypothetical protein
MKLCDLEKREREAPGTSVRGPTHDRPGNKKISISSLTNQQINKQTKLTKIKYYLFTITKLLLVAILIFREEEEDDRNKNASLSHLASYSYSYNKCNPLSL